MVHVNFQCGNTASSHVEAIREKYVNHGSKAFPNAMSSDCADLFHMPNMEWDFTMT